MTKPWEEMWMVAEDNYNDIQRVNTDNGVVTTLFATVDGAPEHSTLAVAAPDMARALMMTGGVHHGEWHADSCWIAPFQPCNDKCRAARAALRKAGALP